MKPFDSITYLAIEANSGCNLSCTWCNRERLVQEGHRDTKNIAPEDFRKLLDYFKDCPIDTIKLVGLSEPFLHPEFDVVASTLKDYFPKAQVLVATNCQYNLEKTRFLEALPFIDMMYLSVDGVGDNYEKIRKGAKFSKLLRTFEDIASKVPQSIREKKLFINFTASEQNYQDIPPVYEICQKYGFGGVRINIVQNWNEDELNSHQFSDAFFEMLTKYKKDLKGVPGWTYSECFWPHSGIVVDVFGNVRQCVINTSQKPLGNVFRDNIEDIFNSSKHYQNMRKLLNSNCAPESCKNCDYHHQSTSLEKLLGGKHMQNTPRKFTRWFDS